MSIPLITQNKECQIVFEKWANPDIAEPNLLFVQPPNGGVGCSEFVQELAKAQHQKSGIKRSFGRCFLSLKFLKDMSEHDIRRFFDSPRVIAEYYNHFIGTFCIDVSDCLYSLESSHFNRLMEYVSSNKSNVKFIFIVSTDDKEAVAALHCVLRRCIRADMLSIGYADAEEYVDYTIRLLQENDIPVAESTKQILTDYIDTLTRKTYFSGYDTICRLVDDIVCELRACNNTKLTGNGLIKLMDICLPGDTNIGPYKRIGF